VFELGGVVWIANYAVALLEKFLGPILTVTFLPH
jgi:hypothetical protein